MKQSCTSVMRKNSSKNKKGWDILIPQNTKQRSAATFPQKVNASTRMLVPLHMKIRNFGSVKMRK
jgi:hypothetical protein